MYTCIYTYILYIHIHMQFIHTHTHKTICTHTCICVYCIYLYLAWHEWVFLSLLLPFPISFAPTVPFYVEPSTRAKRNYLFLNFTVLHALGPPICCFIFLGMFPPLLSPPYLRATICQPILSSKSLPLDSFSEFAHPPAFSI